MLPISVRGMAQPGSIRDLWSPIGLVTKNLFQIGPKASFGTNAKV